MNTTNPKNNQRITALNLLETQLSAGTKPNKVNGKTTKEMIPLTENDKQRIQKEINILKSRIV